MQAAIDRDPKASKQILRDHIQITLKIYSSVLDRNTQNQKPKVEEKL